jgi:hypothetical protein
LASVNQGRPAIAATAKPGEFSGSGVMEAKKAGAPYKAPLAENKAAKNEAAPPRTNGHKATENKAAAPRSDENKPKEARPVESVKPTAAHPQPSLRPQAAPRAATAPHTQPAVHPATTAHAQPVPRPEKEAPKTEERPRQ